MIERILTEITCFPKTGRIDKYLISSLNNSATTASGNYVSIKLKLEENLSLAVARDAGALRTLTLQVPEKKYKKIKFLFLLTVDDRPRCFGFRTEPH